MKKVVLFLLPLLALSACTPEIEEWEWSIRLRPEMAAHRAWREACVELDKYNLGDLVYYVDTDPERHIAEAIDYLASYVSDSMNYTDADSLYSIMKRKKEDGSLHLANNDSWDIKLEGAMLESMLGGGIYSNYSEDYVLKIARILSSEFSKVDVKLNTPVFDRKDKDGEFYTVYCPTFNETYQLYYDKVEEEYSWSLDPIY